MVIANLPDLISTAVLKECKNDVPELPENTLDIMKAVQSRQEQLICDELRNQSCSFCLVNAMLPTQPVVYASDDFCKLTGYESHEIVGKNCRILQGPATNAVETKKIREAVSTGRDIISVLLNYKKDGTAFWNQIQICHLTDAKDQPALIIATQRQVSLDAGPNGTITLKCNSSSSKISSPSSTARMPFSSVVLNKEFPQILDLKALQSSLSYQDSKDKDKDSTTNKDSISKKMAQYKYRTPTSPSQISSNTLSFTTEAEEKDDIIYYTFTVRFKRTAQDFSVQSNEDTLLQLEVGDMVLVQADR